ncbi:MAG: hypothetical protein C9356_05690 [Oleiphilus sp.]|nr:MAG: hypothetical protein C9356_05690 [Oleiphilus sp.]
MRARFNFGVQAAASLPAQQSTPRGVSSGRNGDSAALFQLNTRGLLIHVLLLFALLVSFYLVPASLSVVYWLLCPVALVSPRMALQALVFAACVRYLNPGLFTFGGNIGLASWATLLCAAGRALMSFRPQSLRIMAPIWLFGLVAFATSSVASSFVGVSVMKLLSFLLGASTAIMCACALSRQERAALTTWLAALLVVIVLASLLTLFMPAIAHFRGAGFQGILNHPQSLGALMAPFVSWLLASIYLQHRSLVSPYLFVAVLFVVIIVLSETRTAMVAVALGLAFTFLHYVVRSGRYLSRHSLPKNLSKIMLSLVLLTTMTLSLAPLRDAVFGYVLKRDSANVEEALSSRTHGIDSQWQNFLARPVEGWGFGIYPGHHFAKEIHYFMGIPISAPVEKGFLPTAVLEEVGVVGSIFLLFLLFRMVKDAASNRDIRWLALLYTCVFVNLGEMVFFSSGGIGMFFWVLMALACTPRNAGKKRSLHAYSA